MVENKHIIPVQKRKEANKRPHGSNFHMKKSEVPDGFLMGVRHTVCACRHACDQKKQRNGDQSKRWLLYFQQGKGSCENESDVFYFFIIPKFTPNRSFVHFLSTQC